MKSFHKWASAVVEAAKKQGIAVANIPTYGTASVAQFVFALLLELCHNVRQHADAVRAGEWSRNPDWSFWKSPLMELSGKTMGIVGFGRIGRHTGRIADAMGMRVIAHDTYQGDPPAYEGFRWASVEEVLRESDVGFHLHEKPAGVFEGPPNERRDFRLVVHQQREPLRAIDLR